MNKKTENQNDLIGFDQLVTLFEQTQNHLQKQAARSVDIALVIRNWLFGWYIVEFEQHGAERAKYGSQFLSKLSARLEGKIKGSSTTRLKLYRSFYQAYKNISPTLSVESFKQHFNVTIQQITERFKIGWSHYVGLHISTKQGRVTAETLQLDSRIRF